MADYGFRVRDPSGNIVFDTTTNAARVLGSTTTGGADGSITVSNWTTQGTPWWIMISEVIGGTALPTFSRSGNVLTWTYSGGTGVNVSVLYGVK
jgi:hypothetical protein